MMELENLLLKRLEQTIVLLQENQRQLDSLNQRFSALEAKIEPPQAETVYQQEAARQLQRSNRTLQRWRETGRLTQGIHWWPENGSGSPIYNLLLIRDGLRQGFTSPAHLRACQQWLKQQPSNRKR
ncbi:MAG: hypothetical protein F6K04_02290 [Leptolyngbya sp. SIO4C5]|nr:hypothetical protein [Leptolyngbya sp. SIO4C5]